MRAPIPQDRNICAMCLRGMTLATLALTLACSGGASGPTPNAVLSPSIETERAQRSLLAEWVRVSDTERLGMEPQLQRFCALHPKDPAVRPVEALLAWVALERGLFHDAELRARAAGTTAGPGTVGDLARTVEGAALRRQGHPEAALERLWPLVSKLIDPWVRSLLNQEIVDAAIEAGQWDHGLELMGVWLREAGADEQATVRDHLQQRLGRVPEAKLVRWLAREPGIAQASIEELELRRLVTQRLASLARARQDAALAQALLATSSALLGDQGDAVAQLAVAVGAGKARVEARTLGLLLSLRDDAMRRRGAELVAGVVAGLGLPGSQAHLVLQDLAGTDSRMEQALADLSAAGASIVIAGSDEKDAEMVATFADAHQLPVILLHAPAPSARPDSASRFAFVVGPDLVELENVLVSALAARAESPVAVLADEPVRPRLPRPEVAVVRGCSEATAPWKPLQVGGVVLSAHPDCARAALATAASLHLRFAAGFELSTAALPAGSVVATAGLFPIGSTAPPEALHAWMKEHPSPPSFWTALGHDAAVLAWAAVQALPEQGAEEPRAVAARHADAATALGTVQADLWTTEAKGFGGGRVLPRTLGAR